MIEGAAGVFENDDAERKIKQPGQDHDGQPLQGGQEFLGHAALASAEDSDEQPGDNDAIKITVRYPAKSRQCRHTHNRW